jgi:DNA polymerase-3 subunit epsilon
MLAFLLFCLAVWFSLYAIYRYHQTEQQTASRRQYAGNYYVVDPDTSAPAPPPTSVPQEKAGAWLAANALILDTETTGLDERDEIVDLAVVDCAGKTLMDTIIRPTVPISPGARCVHGITEEMVAVAPTWAAIHDEFCRLIEGRPVVVYNREFDQRMLCQTTAAHGLHPPNMDNFECAMLTYAEYRGSWNSHRGDYRWHKLTTAASQCGVAFDGAHRALGDCLMTRGVIKAMAAGPRVNRKKWSTDGYTKEKWAILKELKQKNMLDEAEKYLAGLVDEAEGDGEEWGVSPWCYEQLAILYRKQKRREDEVAILQRYSGQKKAPGVSADKLAARLIRAEELLAKKNGAKKQGEGP